MQNNVKLQFHQQLRRIFPVVHQSEITLKADITILCATNYVDIDPNK